MNHNQDFFSFIAHIYSENPDSCYIVNDELQDKNWMSFPPIDSDT